MVVFSKLDDTLVFKNAAYANAWRPRIEGVATRTLRISSPCVGLNCPERAARELGLAVVSVDQFDLRLELTSLLREFSGLDNAHYVHAGPIAGNLMSVELKDLEDADGLISGR